ncbi:MAG: fasciclin domain-containing protein [Deltaproteobacteria bacterium]|nr:MAG: fasciclin domain-containing protein [Deltaproteobacteria bacterium]
MMIGLMEVNMKFTRLLVPLTLVAALACNGGDDDSDTVMTESDTDTDTDTDTSLPSILDIATGDDDFSILVDAVTMADLVDTLSGDGPFTVFAPTNAAFQALLDSEADWDSLDDIDEDLLKAVLLYHVVGADIPSSAVTDGAIVSSLSPNEWGHNMSLFASIDSGDVFINTAKVDAPDVFASNGVVHVIDQVILPPNLVDAAELAGFEDGLLAAVAASDDAEGIAGALSGPGPFTVFAPTNAAFEPVFDADPAYTAAEITYVLQSHVVSADEPVVAADLAGISDPVDTLSDEMISFDTSVDPPTCTLGENSAGIVNPDVHVSNGVIHVIDAVLLPPPM